MERLTNTLLPAFHDVQVFTEGCVEEGLLLI